MIGRKRLIIVAGIVVLTGLTAAGLFLADQLLVMSRTNELMGLTEPRIVLRKDARTLEVFDGARLVKSYSVALGREPRGDKEIEGDGRTPEGSFYVFTKNPRSRFYLSLGLSYPNIEDAERGRRDGHIDEAEYEQIADAINGGGTPPQKTKLGGEIYIHGGGTFADWTEGCIALRNRDVNELFEALDVGTPVEIIP